MASKINAHKVKYPTERKREAMLPPSLVWGEVLFVLSILAEYFVLGTIAGSQHLNMFDVYRAGTKWFSRIQIGFYVLGLVFFLVFLPGVIHLQETKVIPQSQFIAPWHM
jgi:hypothetical protein